MSARSPNAVAWLIWFTGVVAVPLVTRNPFYLGISLLAVLFVHLASNTSGQSAGAWRLFAYVGSSVAALSMLFNLLTVHTGDRAFGELPGWLPIIGGALTLNALVYGISSALAISTVLFGAATFNMNVRHGDLVRLMPQGLRRLGVAGGIALAFVPQLITTGRDIYDLQRSRGYRFRGIRDAPVLLVPLLATSMERAITLSEALETRGFGASANSRPSTQRKTLAIGGALGVVTISLWFIATGRLAIGLGVLLAAVIPLLLVSRGGHSRTRLTPLLWDAPSIGVAATAAGPVLVVMLHLTGVAPIGFEPFPRLDAPAFHPLTGLALGLPVAAAFALERT